MKYVIIVLTLALAGLGFKHYTLTVEYDDLKLKHSQAETKALGEKNKALEDQAKVFSDSLTGERRRRAALELKNELLNAELSKLEDYHEKSADSIRLAVDSMLNRAHRIAAGEDLSAAP